MRMRSGADEAGNGLSGLLNRVVSAFIVLITSVIGLIVAAVLAVTSILAGLVLAIGVLMFGAGRRRVRRNGRDPDVIEARHVGGHSWVAYGFNERHRV